MSMRTPLLIVAAVAGLGLLAGCFSDHVAPPVAGLCVAPPDSTPQGSPIIRIVDFEFVPAAVCVSPGTTVTWINEGTQIHTSTADVGAWDSPSLSTGANYSYTFAQAGTLAYHCTPHPFMRATVVVQ